MTLPDLYTLKDVSAAMGISERWIRDQIKDGAEVTRLGHKIRFTTEQFEALVAKHTTAPAVVQSITTGRRKRA